MPFKPGQSGNPAGRPRGSRNRRTIAAEKLFGENGEEYTALAMKLATDGHGRALRLCLDSILPQDRQSPVAFELPPMKTAADAARATGRIMQALAAGDLSAVEAAKLSMKVRRRFAQIIAGSELAERIRKLEAKDRGS
jgi:Family of unknown function (DUF5681)